MPDSTKSLDKKLTTVMTVAVAVIAANLYYLQPLEQSIAHYFAISSGVVGAILTVMLLGNAVGLALIVPLGDILERRKLLKVMLVAIVGGLIFVASAPSAYLLAGGAVIVGASAAAVQIIIPTAARLAADNERGRVVGTVMGGLLLGILLSRIAAGIASSFGGWRIIFVVAVIINAAIGYWLIKLLPKVPPQTKSSYGALLRSMLRLIREESLLRRRIFYGVAVFIPFSAFWSTVGFLLAQPPFEWSEAAIGSFALFGVAGALVARFAGKLTDRGIAKGATGAYLAIMLMSFGLLWMGAHNVAALAIGVVLMDMACQALHVTNQSLIYSIRPKMQSRLATVYMTSFILSGAVGTALAALMYGRYGWTGVCLIGGSAALVGLLGWLHERYLSLNKVR